MINELDQVVKEIRANAVGQGPNPESGLTAFSYERTNIYDSNDNIIEKRIENVDGLDGVSDMIIHKFEYDILDQLTKETWDVGQQSNNLNIINTFGYDPSQNLVFKTRGAGKPEQAIETWLHDERDILVTHTRGVNATEVSTMTTEIDDNGNITGWIDADGGDKTLIEFDGYDRVRRITDRVGNVKRVSYDSANNIIEEQWFGPVDDVSGFTLTFLASTFHRYDQRQRRFQRDKRIFHYAGKEAGIIDNGSLGGPKLVADITIYDRLNRKVFWLDPNRNIYETRYDGLSRILKTIDPEDNEVDFTYDKNNNLITVTETEIGQFNGTTQLINNPEIFITNYTHDSLNRLERIEEPNTQKTFYQYDSRDNRKKIIDALGNQREFRYDRLDRLIDERIFLSVNGLNASAGNFDINQGGGDGRITLKRTWDDLHRPKKRIDDKDQETEYFYDDLDRKIRCEYHDDTSELWTYNADSELQTHTDQRGNVETWTHDAASKPTQMDLTNQTANTLGTTLKTWGYDGLNRVTTAFDNNDASDPNDDVTCVYFYDSLSRVIQESQTIGNSSDLKTVFLYEGQVREEFMVYPNMRSIQRWFDGLDRIVEMDNFNAAGGNPYRIRHFYVGPERDLQSIYRVSPGGFSFRRFTLDKRNDSLTQTIGGTNPGYDTNRRHINHHWQRTSTFPTLTINNYTNIYNGANELGTNRRVTEIREHLNHRDDYTFDSHYRMTEFDRDQDLNQQGGLNSIRTFDGVDNMTSFMDEGFNQNPQVDTLIGEDGVNQYSEFGNQSRIHDDSANLTDPGHQQYFFDYQNRLTEIRDQAGLTVAQYKYDTKNRRVLKIASGDATRYLYHHWEVCEERDFNTDEVLKQYLIGRKIDEHILLTNYEKAGTPQYFYHCNSQGSVGALTDEQGEVVEYYEYSMLGRPRIVSGDQSTILSESLVGNTYMFHGRRFDPESGLYYYRNRYLDPRTGRFISYDPNGNWHHGQGNGYSAFNEDSWNYKDPMGLHPDHPYVGSFEHFTDTMSDLFVWTKEVIVKPAVEGFKEANKEAANKLVEDIKSGSPEWDHAKKQVNELIDNFKLGSCKIFNDVSETIDNAIDNVNEFFQEGVENAYDMGFLFESPIPGVQNIVPGHPGVGGAGVPPSGGGGGGYFGHDPKTGSYQEPVH